MKVAIFTSGGDAPGMNAAVRAVTRTLIQNGHEVFGFEEGYRGVLSSTYRKLDLRDVANIIHRGGTILKTSRCDEFQTKEGRIKAFENLKVLGVEVLVGLGGDGTFAGLEVFHKEHSSVQVIGVPCTIDNDYEYSENTIGFATATETAVQAIDKIRDTASSHQRTFVIEVMGRKSTHLAYAIAISAGAESVVDPSKQETLDLAVSKVQKSIEKGKLSSLIVALERENDGASSAYYIRDEIKKRIGIDCKSLVLGHIQRGGSPLSQDRLLASEMGYLAALQVGKGSGVVVQNQGKICFSSFTDLKVIENRESSKKLILETLAN
jgi:6-phosphofructokinase 1